MAQAQAAAPFSTQPVNQPLPQEMPPMHTGSLHPIRTDDPSANTSSPAYEHPHATADVRPPPAETEVRPVSDSFYRQPPYQVRGDGFPASRDSRPASEGLGRGSTGQRGSDRPGLMKKFPAL